MACLCSLCVPVANQVPVLVLQHPNERRQAKGSVSLLRLSLMQCVVEVGETFEPQQLQHWLHADGRGSVLLYPSQAGTVPATPTPSAVRRVRVSGRNWSCWMPPGARACAC